MIEIDSQLLAVRPDGRGCELAASPRLPSGPRRRKSQQGAIAIMFIVMLIVMIGFCGMALDLGRLYNRKVELQGLANSAALAAARELNGTTAGVASALDKAAAAANLLKYQYNQRSITWTDAAIRFSVTPPPAANWLDAGAARAAPDGLLFVKVDTSELDPTYGAVNAVFMGLLSSSLAAASTGGHAVAGRSSINVVPLAVCALSANPAASRANPGPPANAELVEYGFRRGVSYDLMRLNPGGTAAENFVVDPIAPPGAPGSSSNLAASVVAPFVCTGSMAMPRVMGAAVNVGRPFPIASLFNQLNSRFDQFSGGLCNPGGAPPDLNIKSYVYTGISWMNTAPGSQTALSTTTGGQLRTIADPWPAPASNTAPMYGPLWSFARAVPFASYTPGVPEPANGYAAFSPSAWSTLYKPGQPAAGGSYPGASATPYRANAGVNFQAPSAAHKGVRNRRVLNLPLLSCPVGAGANPTATVLAIGKFFMTVPATATSLSAEFAGVAPEQTLGGQVELYP